MDNSTTDLPSYRLLNPKYKDRKGFNANFNDGPVDDADLGRALDRHRTAAQTIVSKGHEIPSFQELQQYVERIETPASIRQSIKELQDAHLQDLIEFYALRAEEYHVEAEDFYNSVDEQALSRDSTDIDAAIVASCESLEKLYGQQQISLATDAQLSGEFTRMRQIYLRRLLELQQHLRSLEEREAITRRNEASKFPRSSSEWHSSSRDAKARVAKFLVADQDKETQEKMMDEFQWAWRNTTALTEEYRKDQIFQATVKSFHQQQSVLNSLDPRLKR